MRRRYKLLKAAVTGASLSDFDFTGVADGYILKYSAALAVFQAVSPTNAFTSAAISDFTEAAQDAVGNALVDSSTIDFTYTDASNQITAAVIDASITYAKMQNVSAASKLLGRGDSGSGSPQEITLGTGLSMSGTTLNSSGGTSSGSNVFSGCAVTNSGNQTATTGVNLTLTWDTESYDTDSYHSTSSNTSRITVPFSGKYLFFCDVLWDTNTTGRRIAFFQKNGSVATSSVDTRGAVSSTEQVIATVLDLVAGDYVELIAFQDSGANRTISSTRTNFGCTFLQVPTPGGTFYDGARVSNSTSQTIGSGSEVSVTWDTEAFDVSAYHDTSSNTNRFTIPRTGKYLITAALSWDTNTTGRRALNIKDNAGVYLTSTLVAAQNNTGNACSTVVNLTAGQWVEVTAFQDSGANRTITGSFGQHFSITYLGTADPTTNVTVDTHASSPAAADDEFETGSVIDTTGSRRAGATAWSWFNQGTLVGTVAQGALQIANTNQAASVRGVTQTPSGATYKYRCKMSFFTAANNTGAAGIMLGRSGKLIVLACGYNNGGFFFINKWTNATTSSSTSFGTAGDVPAIRTSGAGNGVVNEAVYLEVEYDGTNVIFRCSGSGYNNSFGTFLSETAATFLGGAPDTIGLVIHGSAIATAFSGTWDWFRKVA